MYHNAFPLQLISSLFFIWTEKYRNRKWPSQWCSGNHRSNKGRIWNRIKQNETDFISVLDWAKTSASWRPDGHGHKDWPWWLGGQWTEEIQPLSSLSHMKFNASSSAIGKRRPGRQKQFIREQTAARTLHNANTNKLKLEMTFLIVLKHGVLLMAI